jgi:hypothetical protein
MNILDRFVTWVEAPGVRRAALNAWRAIEETAEAKAAVDARCAQLMLTTAPHEHESPSRAA